MLWGSVWGPASKARLRRLHSAGGVLLAAGAQLAGPASAGAAEEGKRTLKVENLNTFQKAAQKSYFQVSWPLALSGPWPPARLRRTRGGDRTNERQSGTCPCAVRITRGHACAEYLICMHWHTHSCSPEVPPAQMMNLSCAQNRAEAELRKVLKKEDASATLRLVLHDAATFDIATRTGGMNGSIVTR